jgi:4-amino-4-deoxy-L-arabinose transferase-like glycosyltransferase
MKYLLPLILILAFVLRFLSLTNFPVGFNADEASFGYDAYSILHTGRDQWGNFFPTVLKSFGDYKSPLYSYLAIPTVAIFGLNVFATRLPNVIIGVFAVFSVYLLVNRLTNRGKWPGLFAALLLAVNPWSVMMSRGAFEANLITFFLPFGIYLFLSGLQKPKLLTWSAIFLGLSLFTYHSAKLITPLVILGLAIIFYRQIKKLGFKKLVPGALIFLIFFLGMLNTFRLGGGSRISERSIASGALEEGARIKIGLIQEGMNPIIARVLHNKYQVMVQRFIGNYRQYFSSRFFISDGAGEATYGMIPGIGVLYMIEIVLLFGLIPLILQKEYLKVIGIIFLWLLIAPLPAALATGRGFSGNRAEGMLPVLQILETFGFIGWTLVIKKINKKAAPIFLAMFLIAVTFETGLFARKYFQDQSNVVAGGMLYGDLEVGKWLSENETGKDVIVSRSLSEPQIFLAFGGKWNPLDYQKSSRDWKVDVWVDQIPEYHLGKYTIKSLDWKNDRTKANILIVGRPEEFPVDVSPIKVFYYSDRSPNVYIIDPSQKLYAKAF